MEKWRYEQRGAEVGWLPMADEMKPKRKKPVLKPRMKIYLAGEKLKITR